MVSIPFREDLYSDSRAWFQRETCSAFGFHPFQGRPLFGRREYFKPHRIVWIEFPSLSGKTSIRTVYKAQQVIQNSGKFPSLSGKTSIRTPVRLVTGSRSAVPGFHPFQGRPLFGQETKRMKLNPFIPDGFHPFQGRPLFGLDDILMLRKLEMIMEQVSIPFREDLYSDSQESRRNTQEYRQSFHPFQGRPLFGRRQVLLVA